MNTVDQTLVDLSVLNGMETGWQYGGGVVMV